MGCSQTIMGWVRHGVHTMMAKGNYSRRNPTMSKVGVEVVVKLKRQASNAPVWVAVEVTNSIVEVPKGQRRFVIPAFGPVS